MPSFPAPAGVALTRYHAGCLYACLLGQAEPVCPPPCRLMLVGLTLPFFGVYLGARPAHPLQLLDLVGVAGAVGAGRLVTRCRAAVMQGCNAMWSTSLSSALVCCGEGRGAATLGCPATDGLAGYPASPLAGPRSSRSVSAPNLRLAQVSGLLIAYHADSSLREFILTNSDRKRQGLRPKPVLDYGLWRLSRHPAHFGEQLLWWSISLFGATSGQAWTVCGTAFNTLIMLQARGGVLSAVISAWQVARWGLLMGGL